MCVCVCVCVYLYPHMCVCVCTCLHLSVSLSVDGNQYEQLRIPRDQNVPDVEIYSQLQVMT